MALCRKQATQRSAAQVTAECGGALKVSALYFKVCSSPCISAYLGHQHNIRARLSVAQSPCDFIDAWSLLHVWCDSLGHWAYWPTTSSPSFSPITDLHTASLMPCGRGMIWPMHVWLLPFCLLTPGRVLTCCKSDHTSSHNESNELLYIHPRNARAGSQPAVGQPDISLWLLCGYLYVTTTCAAAATGVAAPRNLGLISLVKPPDAIPTTRLPDILHAQI